MAMQTKDGQEAQRESSKTGRHITATFLENHFTANDAGTVARLSVLITGLLNAPTKEVNQACRDWSQAYKDRPRERSVVQTRASEVKALKAAMDTGSFTPDVNLGYHKNVQAARATLESLGLNNQGRPIVDREEVAKKRDFVAMQVAALDAANGDLTVAASAEVQEQAKADVQRAQAEKAAAGIVKRYGAEIAMLIADAIPGAIEAMQRAGHDANAQADAATATGTEEVQQPQAATA